MKRTLSGKLEHLAPPALLRLVSATSPSGVLEIITGEGSLRLEVDRGRVERPPRADLEQAGRILGCLHGEFRFTPGEVRRLEGEVINLTSYAEAAGAAASSHEMDLLLEDDFLEMLQPFEPSDIHVLPAAPPENPLEDLLSDLEEDAPGELLFGEVGVVTQDPRWWRGALERDWRRRGWRIHYLLPDDALPNDLDVLVVHHQQASARIGAEAKWLQIVARAAERESPVPVVWVAPHADPDWVHSLIEAGVSFLMPAPQGDTGEAVKKFVESLSRVVERQIQALEREGHSPLPSGVSDLVGALLSESEPDHGIGSLLHLAAEHFKRGAVLMAEQTVFRCRAGFGYPLDHTTTTLQRGIDFIERVARSGEALTSIAPDADGVRGLAGVLGVSDLPDATAIIPLGRSGAVAGVLVADCEGEELPDLADLVLLVGRLGGAVV